MISIDKNTVIKPNVLNDSKIERKLLKIKEIEKPGDKIKNLYNHEEVKKILNSLYHNKCAYCEGLANNAKSGTEMDHYRPKNGIKGINNHKGYYWLGYEWTNLLPTCEKCNGKKSNQFPLQDEKQRISDNLEIEGFIKSGKFIWDNFHISKLTRENPLLLNPEIDKVEEHFYFLPSGEIKPLTEKGVATINICDLNRGSLIYERKKIADDIFRDVLDIFSNTIYSPSSHNDMLKKLWKDKVLFTNEHEYSRYHYFIYNYFDFFVIKKFEFLGLNSVATKLSDFFKQYKTD